jgi:hypothetical protein
MVRCTIFNDRGESRSLLLFYTDAAFIVRSTAAIESEAPTLSTVLVLHSYITWRLLLNSILVRTPNIPINKPMLEYHPSTHP